MPSLLASSWEPPPRKKAVRAITEADMPDLSALAEFQAKKQMSVPTTLPPL
jgi:hypothetical protein